MKKNTTARDLTLVTAFYDLSKYEKRNIEKSIDNYFMWAEFLFALDINLVIFIPSEYNQRVISARKKYNLLGKTLIILKEFENLAHIDNLGQLEQYFNETNVLLDNTVVKARYTTKYAIINWNKLYFLEEIVKLNPFKTNYFGWIDFGIYYSTRNSEYLGHKRLVDIQYRHLEQEKSAL